VIRKPPTGFTLVELIVVMALIAVFLAFALPEIRPAGGFKNRAEDATDLARIISMIKHQALQENRDFQLHLDMDGTRAWLTHSGMDAAALEKARSDAKQFPARLRVTGMEFAALSRHGGTEIQQTRSDPVIRFSRNGYSDNMILHVTDNGSPFSLKVSPFLMEVETVSEHVSYDDCP
jgi:prepilin-type N-terminal cleavage/methylation domain-containing protein